MTSMPGTLSQGSPWRAGPFPQKGSCFPCVHPDAPNPSHPGPQTLPKDLPKLRLRGSEALQAAQVGRGPRPTPSPAGERLCKTATAQWETATVLHNLSPAWSLQRGLSLPFPGS